MAWIGKRTYRDPRTGEVRHVDHYTIQYRDASGKIRRVRGYKSKNATKQLCRELERSDAFAEVGAVREIVRQAKVQHLRRDDSIRKDDRQWLQKSRKLIRQARKALESFSGQRASP